MSAEVVGHKIARIRAMGVEEAVREGWESLPPHISTVVLELDNGTLLYPSQDPEGNGPGALFGVDSTGTFMLLP